MMNRLRIIVTVFVIMVITACKENIAKTNDNNAIVEQSNSESNTAGATKESLPEFLLMDVNGNPVNLQNFRGKKIFVNLWATWCPPCRAEIPSIEKLYRATDTNKVAFIMVSLDDNFEKAKKYANKKKLKLPIYYPQKSLTGIFNVSSIPSTFIFDESGNLIQSIEGAADYNTSQFRDMLK
ncbi:TlpA family protein disulfide reductase [Flavisolibacter ginsengisoli]|jgi:thiol-disulfide isomerase/thioredoxin|nr:TlpA disulfide reductase family protein [Flavisolibacter ginsengisoli]